MINNKEPKVNLEQFICSLIESSPAFKDEGRIPCMYAAALEDQGLEYKEGKLVKSHRRVAAEAKETGYAKHQPKFKVGDYIANDYCFGKVVEINDDTYLLDTEQGIPFSYEHNAHLWNVATDAKDGDILYSESCKLLWIYKDNKTCHAGCNLNYKLNGVVIDESICIPSDARPASKKLCDYLLSKMREADYTWDADEKCVVKLLSAEIPFGADSELLEETITIPRGCYAVVDDGRVVIRKLSSMERNGKDWKELTEFETAVKDELLAGFQDLSKTKTLSRKLLAIARKQFIEQSCKWLKENARNYVWSEKYYDDVAVEAFREFMTKEE